MDSRFYVAAIRVRMAVSKQ